MAELLYLIELDCRGVPNIMSSECTVCKNAKSVNYKKEITFHQSSQNANNEACP